MSVLELLPLSGDHSGKVSGKLIFKALCWWEIKTKLYKSLNITMVTKLMIIYICRCEGH